MKISSFTEARGKAGKQEEGEVNDGTNFLSLN